MSKQQVATQKKPALPANFQQQMDQEVAEIQSRIAAPSGDLIKWKAGQGFIGPDGNAGDALTAVILDFVATNRYFDRPFVADEPGVPACFAIGVSAKTLVPSESAPARQAASCGECPQNEFGSDPKGGKGKACRNYRLMALLPATEDPGVVSEDEAPIQLLQVPPTSIKNFDGYVNTVATKHRLSLVGMVTRIKTDATAQFSNVGFEIVRQLTPAEMATYMARREEGRQRLLQEPDVSQYQPLKPRSTRR